MKVVGSLSSKALRGLVVLGAMVAVGLFGWRESRIESEKANYMSLRKQGHLIGRFIMDRESLRFDEELWLEHRDSIDSLVESEKWNFEFDHRRPVVSTKWNNVGSKKYKILVQSDGELEVVWEKGIGVSEKQGQATNLDSE